MVCSKKKFFFILLPFIFNWILQAAQFIIQLKRIAAVNSAEKIVIISFIPVKIFNFWRPVSLIKDNGWFLRGKNVKEDEILCRYECSELYEWRESIILNVNISDVWVSFSRVLESTRLL